MRHRNLEVFTTIKTEGALLPAELLKRLAGGDRQLEGLIPESYHLSKNEKINEVVNRAWNRCAGAWQAFSKAAEELPSSDAGTTLTRERWLLVLFQELGYGRLLTSKAQEIGGKSYPISHSWHHTPIHLVSFRQDLDTRTPGMAGAARLSPHSLVQELLNRSENHLWGVVSNGQRLRILRDNLSLTRQAFLEFDLEAMMNGEVYSDFILVFLLLHQSRLEAEKPDECWLELWSKESQERGTRALDQLRNGVEDAIKTLGQGFLAHPANKDLRDKLQKGTLTREHLYQQLLRLVYRLIFLFVAEDRSLLLLPDAPAEAKKRYMQYYSLSRLRRLAGRLRGTRHGDLWQGLRQTFHCLAEGESALALAPLGSFLFSEEALSSLNQCELANDALLLAVRHLSYTTERKFLRPVDYRNLGTEELGSVYESLLELHPEVNVSASIFDLKVAAGSERKTTGSYYTHTSLINCLLDSALEPVIAERLHEAQLLANREVAAEHALLSLRLCDPACGSGHFLIAAAHRIGKHLAAIRTGESEPPPEKRREALRDVASHCIYGVDLNPLAVELCKVALWIETLDPGRPLGFLDHRIKCGNSLIGATPELLANGIPDDAFKPKEGDDSTVAGSIRRKNREERRGQQNLFMVAEDKSNLQEFASAFSAWAALPEETAQQVTEKAKKFEALQSDYENRHQRQLADLWTAAFFWPLRKETYDSVPTQDFFRRFRERSYEIPPKLFAQMEDISSQHRFFHWFLEFPEVFASPNPSPSMGETPSSTPSSPAGEANLSIPSPSMGEGLPCGVSFNTPQGKSGGGFDVVLGNPPWERIKLQEKEFFAQKDPEIANAPNAAARKRLIAQLQETNPSLWSQFLEAKRSAECESHFLRASERYPLSAVGDINTYQIFAGLARQLVSKSGRVGIIVPSGIATDDTNKHFFADLTEKKALVSLYDFENREKLFPDVDSRMKFCLLTMGGENAAPKGADFAFFLTNTSQLREDDRHFSLSDEDIALLNPNTRTCPIFRSRIDAELTRWIYQANHASDKWPFLLGTLFHSSNDADKFEDAETLEKEGWSLDSTGCFNRGIERAAPLYEGKMFTHYDHRAATVFLSHEALVRQRQSVETSLSQHQDPYFFARPFFWVRENNISQEDRWKWIVCFKKVTSPTNERTLISSLLPSCAANDSIHLLFPEKAVVASEFACLLANLSALPLDYVGRQKLGGVNFNFFIFEQLPLLSASLYHKPCIWFCGLKTLQDWLLQRILELTYTAWDLEPFAKDCGWVGPPFRWDEERRFLIRCELDAAFFHLYLGPQDEWRRQPESLTQYFPTPRHAVDHIMETFPIVKRKDEEKHGEYRTKRVILEIYDEMAEAMRTGNQYKTRLDPPPADPRCCHPPRGGKS